MKTTFLALFLLIASCSFGQEFKRKTSGGGDFGVSTSTQTQQVLTVSGVNFQVYTTTSGSKFVKCISASGKEYPVWVGERTTSIFEGSEVYVMKSGAYCYYKLNKNGYPVPTYLIQSK